MRLVDTTNIMVVLKLTFRDGKKRGPVQKNIFIFRVSTFVAGSVGTYAMSHR
jgi:hypothetical protein